MGTALAFALLIPTVGQAAYHEGKAGNPCNPCAAKQAQPCNPCAAKEMEQKKAKKKAAQPCNPCAAKQAQPCNPCAPKNPCGRK
jgi:hypothetical protein